MATTTTETVWMPPPATGHPANIYAAIVTAAPSATDYLLACEQSFATPYPAECAELESWTLTYGSSTMRLDMGSKTIDCERGGGDALCVVHFAGNSPTLDDVSTTSVASLESAAWYTAVTVVPMPDQDQGQEDDLESDEEEDEDGDEEDEEDTKPNDKDWGWGELLKKREASATTTSGKCRPTNSKVKREPRKGSSGGGSGRSGRSGSSRKSGSSRSRKGPGGSSTGGSGRGRRRKGAGAAAASRGDDDDDCDNAAAGGAVANLKLTGVLAGVAVGFVMFGL